MRRLVTTAGTMVIAALAMGLIATSVFGLRADRVGGYNGYGYGCEDPFSGYGYGYGGCDDAAPVYDFYADGESGTTSFNGGRFRFTNNVPGDVDVDVMIDQETPDEGDPPPSGFVSLGDLFVIELTDAADNTPIEGEFDPPLEIELDVPGFASDIPDDELVAFYDEGGPWQEIPYLGSIDDGDTPPTLGTREDGYYITHYGPFFRTITILTKHLTTFTFFRQPPPSGGGDTGGGTVTPPPAVAPPPAGGPPPPVATPPVQTLAPVRISATIRRTVKRNRFVVVCKITGGLGIRRCSVKASARIKRKRRSIASGSAPLRNSVAKVRVTLNRAGRRALRKRLSGVTLKVSPVPRQAGVKALSKRVTLVKAKRRGRS